MVSLVGHHYRFTSGGDTEQFPGCRQESANCKAYHSCLDSPLPAELWVNPETISCWIITPYVMLSWQDIVRKAELLTKNIPWSSSHVIQGLMSGLNTTYSYFTSDHGLSRPLVFEIQWLFSCMHSPKIPTIQRGKPCYLDVLSNLCEKGVLNSPS